MLLEDDSLDQETFLLKYNKARKQIQVAVDETKWRGRTNNGNAPSTQHNLVVFLHYAIEAEMAYGHKKYTNDHMDPTNGCLGLIKTGFPSSLFRKVNPVEDYWDKTCRQAAERIGLVDMRFLIPFEG